MVTCPQYSATAYLPKSAEPLAGTTGTLSLDKVVELTRFATGATEKELIAWARRVTPAAIRAAPMPRHGGRSLV